MIDLKTRGSYIEGNKATMYRFFDELKRIEQRFYI